MRETLVILSCTFVLFFVFMGIIYTITFHSVERYIKKLEAIEATARELERATAQPVSNYATRRHLRKQLKEALSALSDTPK